MIDEALQVTDLSVDRAGRPVLRKNTFVVKPGVITALLGRNGAGKSTLVMAIAGVLPARSGHVELGGVRLLGAPPNVVRQRGVAVVPQGHPVFDNLTVLDNLRAAGLFLSRPEAEREVASALEVLPELREKLTVVAQALSSGQKQMVTIAQALIARPRFLLIDELSFGLAPAIVTRLGERIAAIARRGVGILLIEQFTTFALSLSSEALVLELGKIVFSGTTDQLRCQPEILHGAYLATATKPLADDAGTAR